MRPLIPTILLVITIPFSSFSGLARKMPEESWLIDKSYTENKIYKVGAGRTELEAFGYALALLAYELQEDEQKTPGETTLSKTNAESGTESNTVRKADYSFGKTSVNFLSQSTRVSDIDKDHATASSDMEIVFRIVHNNGTRKALISNTQSGSETKSDSTSKSLWTAKGQREVKGAFRNMLFNDLLSELKTEEVEVHLTTLDNSSFALVTYPLLNKSEAKSSRSSIPEAPIITAGSGKYSSPEEEARAVLTEGHTAFMVSKDYVKASKFFKRYCELTENKEERGLAFLGFSYYLAKKYPEALDAFTKLKQSTDGTLQSYWPNLDILMEYAGKPSGTPPDAVFHLPQAQLHEAAFFEAGDLSKDKKHRESLKLLLPGAVFFAQHRDSSSSTLCYLHAGIDYYYLDDTDSAKNCYQECIQLGGRASCYYNLSLLVPEDEKVRVLEMGWKRFPDDKNIAGKLASHYYDEAGAFFDAKQYPSAISVYRKSLNCDNSNPDAWVALGFAFYYNKENANCLAALKSARKLNPNIGQEVEGVNQLFQLLDK